MWVLQLNDMRASQIEIVHPVARAETREALQAFMDRERVEPYNDERWGKSFRQGGPLEWCNPPFSGDRAIVHVGSREEAAQRAADSAPQW